MGSKADANDYYREQKRLVEKAQKYAENKAIYDKARLQAARLSNAGVMGVPQVGKQMSEKDRNQYIARMDKLAAENPEKLASAMQAKNPGAEAKAGVVAGKPTLNNPAGTPINDRFQNLTAEGFDKLERARIANRTEADVRSKAMTGEVVQTPYGPVASLPPKEKDWQQELVARFPEIGKEGTPENLAFVQAFKSGGADPTKAHEIASGIYNRRTVANNNTQPGNVDLSGSCSIQTGKLQLLQEQSPERPCQPLFFQRRQLLGICQFLKRRPRVERAPLLPRSFLRNKLELCLQRPRI